MEEGFNNVFIMGNCLCTLNCPRQVSHFTLARGAGAADGGRDLEALFFAPNDSGEMTSLKWWIECKGRKGTVEADEVKSAINNALAYEGLHCIVIATNTQFSNPTRDWVKQWQIKHPIPQVQLWDQAQLERYLSRHPDVVLWLNSGRVGQNSI